MIRKRNKFSLNSEFVKDYQLFEKGFHNYSLDNQCSYIYEYISHINVFGNHCPRNVDVLVHSWLISTLCCCFSVFEIAPACLYFSSPGNSRECSASRRCISNRQCDTCCRPSHLRPGPARCLGSRRSKIIHLFFILLVLSIE